MKKKLTILIALLILAVGAACIIQYRQGLKHSAELYRNTIDNYTEKSPVNGPAIVFAEDPDDIGEILLTQSGIQSFNDAQDSGYDSIDSDADIYSYRYNGPWENQLNVDVKRLNADYNDVKAWILFENEDISYPVVWTIDDQSYLRSAFNGDRSSSGSIFIEAYNMPDFSDPHTIIYGHNMRNGTMFGHLRSYLDRAGYYDYHQYFQIIYIDESGQTVKSRYKVFAYGKVGPTDKIYTVCRQNDAAFAGVIEFIKDNMTIASGMPDYQCDRVVSLSTCSTGGDRMVVCGVEIDRCLQ